MDVLFDLIKSLSKGEKKMIRVKAEQNQKGGKSNYLLLFDIYENLSTFDKALLKKKADKVGIKQLPVLKVRLYHFILATIRRMYSDKRKIYEVRELIDYSDILIEKNLFEASRKMLLKAGKLAKEYSFIHENFLINEKLKGISILTNDLEKIAGYVTDKKSLGLLNELELIQQYQELIYESKYNLIQNFRYGIEYDKTSIEGIKQGLHKLEQQNEGLKKPEAAELKTNEIWSFIYLAENNFEESIRYRRKVLAQMNEHKVRIQDNPLEWLYHTKMLIATLSLGNFKEELKEEMLAFNDVIEGMTFKYSNTQLTYVIKSTVFMIRLNYLITNELYEEGRTLLDEIFAVFKDGFDRLDLNNKQVLFYNITLIYLGNKEYKNALKWINRLINTDYKSTRVDLQIYVRFLNIVVHFELGNHRMIENLVHSTKRYFLVFKKELSSFDHLFFDFALKSLAYGGDKEAFLNAKKSVEGLKDRTFEEYFDFEKWMDSYCSSEKKSN